MSGLRIFAFDGGVDISMNEVLSLGTDKDPMRWYVLRDLKRRNAKLPGYKDLAERGIEVFTPMSWRLAVVRGKKVREEIPVINDLLFARERRSVLDPIIMKIPTLQYRFVKGGGYNPLTIRDKDMEQFMSAVRFAEKPRFYSPEELTPDMYGKSVRLEGGPLDGFEGRLLSVKGSRKKRVVIELPNLIAVSVEVNPEYICVVG